MKFEHLGQRGVCQDSFTAFLLYNKPMIIELYCLIVPLLAAKQKS